MAARRFENVAFPEETRQIVIDTKAAAALPPVHSAHQTGGGMLQFSANWLDARKRNGLPG
jgi:5-keto 4-deoxyuronate isomerase